MLQVIGQEDGNSFNEQELSLCVRRTSEKLQTFTDTLVLEWSSSEKGTVLQTSAQTHIPTHPYIGGFKDDLARPEPLTHLEFQDLGTEELVMLCPSGGRTGIRQFHILLLNKQECSLADLP